MSLINTIIEGKILLINKPLNWTSFDVVNKIKWLMKPHFPKLKIGHAGTLDPLAEGLLVVCTQQMTKQVEMIQAQSKTYHTAIFIGATRPSFDRETDIDRLYDTTHITDKLIEDTIHSFIGIQQQIPPKFSAIKQGGKPIYLKARKGISVTILPREIEIYDINILKIALPIVEFEVKCSKGTYIRSLAHDIGQKLNSGAYLYSLIRTQIGQYSLENALNIDDIEKELKQVI